VIPNLAYTAIERFDHDNGERWSGYVRWLGRSDLLGVISLDAGICPPVVHAESGDDWQFVVQQEFMLDFFTDLDFVRRRAAKSSRRYHVLAVARNPTAEEVAGFADARFQLAGFDVVDAQFTKSALLNGSRFPGVLSISELSRESALVPARERAFAIRDALERRHPDPRRVPWQAWGIWRYAAAA